MEFILILILFCLFLAPAFKKSSGDGASRKNGNADLHDPADTFYLEDGLDHEVDNDGYCEECDDYHEVYDDCDDDE